MDRLGETELVHASLEAALQEVLNLEGQHVIELHAGLVEHTDTDQTTNEGVAFEETLRVLLVEREQLTVGRMSVLVNHNVLQIRDLPSGTTDLGEGEHDTPHLTLVAETIFANDLQLGVTVSC